MEKMILRDAFAHENLLPFEVLWRKKEAFSDGVSAKTDSWYLRTAAHASSCAKTDRVYTHNPPRTEEGRWYRDLFVDAYGDEAATLIPYMWMPRWIEGATDPSARTLHNLY